MNRFLNRNVRPQKRTNKKSRSTIGDIAARAANMEILREMEHCWASLEDAREKGRRSVMYAYEDQWGDYVKDPETDMLIREADLIRKNGKVPLKNNMISPIIKSIEGQYRTMSTQSICSVRDPAEAKIGELMSIAVEYVSDLNDLKELDPLMLKIMLCFGFIGERIEYGWNSATQSRDVWVMPSNPSRLFFNTNIEDIRGWDLTCIGEIFDMPVDKVVSLFAHSAADKKNIEDIYSVCSNGYFIGDGLQGRENKQISFYTPTRTDLCRVILGWRLETREAYFCHDFLHGTYYYVGADEIAGIKTENELRKAEAIASGVLPEDILLIEYEYGYEQYWYYRYMTPWGDILQEGRSPYWHGSHNYVIHAYPMIAGKVFNYIEDFIDQQRAINRTLTLIDFIRGASSKGLLIVDETAFDGMERQEIVDEYVRYNGALFCKLKPGMSINNVITQLNGQGAIAGDYELLNLQIKLINEISGVNSAVQGKPPVSGTAASLYAQQAQNSSLNVKGLFDSFNSFRRRRDYKMMQTIQQYYEPSRYIELAGTFYSKESDFCNPEKVQNVQIDLKLVDGMNTPAYQMYENNLLLEMWKAGAVDTKTYLENCTLPFAPRLLEAIKRNEQQAMETGKVPAPGSIQPPEEGQSTLLGRALNDTFANPDDGIVKKA